MQPGYKMNPDRQTAIRVDMPVTLPDLPSLACACARHCHTLSSKSPILCPPLSLNTGDPVIGRLTQ